MVVLSNLFPFFQGSKFRLFWWSLLGHLYIVQRFVLYLDLGSSKSFRYEWPSAREQCKVVFFLKKILYVWTWIFIFIFWLYICAKNKLLFPVLSVVWINIWLLLEHFFNNISNVWSWKIPYYSILLVLCCFWGQLFLTQQKFSRS